MNEIAIIGWTKNPWNFEAQLFPNFQDFLKHCDADNSYSLYILQCPADIDELRSQLQQLPKPSRLRAQIVLVGTDSFPAAALTDCANDYPVVSMHSKKDKDRVADLLNAILLTQRLEEQSMIYNQLRQEEESRQERQYQSLLNELSQQQQQISEIQTRLLTSLQQEKILHDTVLIIMTSQGLAEIELRLQETLAPIMGPLHIRIILHQGSTHPQTFAPPAMAFPLHEQETAIGNFVAHPLENRSFNRRDLKILENISEAVALHIPRFLAFEANTALENEWRSTFDAISDPLILVSESYQVIEANKAAKFRMRQEPPFSEPCFRLMFQRETPCEFCHWGSRSSTQAIPIATGEQWELSSHQLKGHSQKIYVHLYRNKFDQIQLEKKITTYAQAAEVGVFRASLAHELNNPIGGLLTLAQLQKMDLPVDHPLYNSMAQIERLAFECRDLIQQLLQKARQ
jgi:two-component system NtrC family sensor kinase